MNIHVKTVGMNGQISLGKEFAGKMVLIDQVEAGTWVIRTGDFVPDSEQWLHEKSHKAKLERALVWAAQNKPSDNWEEFSQDFKNV
jgi:hypothetical protein